MKVYGGAMPGESYTVQQFHMHWGSAKSKFGFGGSEHLVNSIRYWGEMHIVMVNDQYETNHTHHSDGLGVLGFFIDVRQHQ